MAQFRSILSSDPGPRFEECKRLAIQLLRKATDEWVKGDPEDPSPEKILEEILNIFEDQKFLRRPW